MSFSFVAVLVKLTNRRRGKTPTVTCSRIYCAIHDLPWRFGYFFANSYSAGQRLNADEVFPRPETNSPEILL
jgi:hypothetical protein